MALLFLWTHLSSLANILFAIVKHPPFQPAAQDNSNNYP
jgi:hypothetical protein